LTSVGRKICGWELETSTAIGGFFDSRGECCRLLGFFAGLVSRFPLSSSLLAEFLEAWK
jgi:hypothetical protein